MLIARGGKAFCTILVSKKADEIELFAASELEYYIRRISGAKIPIKKTGKGNFKGESIVVGKTLSKQWEDRINEACFDYDSFLIKTVGNELILTGSSPRGTLYSVYAFLEWLGIRWLTPGVNGEVIPRCRKIQINNVDIIQSPSFKYRTFTNDAGGSAENKNSLRLWIRESKDFIDWMAKNKANRIFFLGAPEEIVKKELVPELKKRGIILEIGGHLLPSFLPRKYYKSHPEYFRLSSGKRVADGNFCSSNRKALAIVKKNALTYIKKHLEAETFHFWADDVLGGSWCECNKCKNLLPVEQSWNVSNKIGKEVYKLSKDKKISFLIYHDTFHPTGKINFSRNNFGLYAPRERCYAHSLDFPNCRRNKWYREQLDKWNKLFRDNIYIFEYYNDMILFRTMAVPLTQTIAGDLKFYKKKGIDKIQSLMFGKYSWWAYPLNLYVFSKVAWNTEEDLSKILDDFCISYYGNAGNLMKQYYDMLEEGMRKIIGYCGYKGDAIGDLRFPPQTQEPFVREHVANIKQGIDILKTCKDILRKVVGKAHSKKILRKIRDEEGLLVCTTREAEALYHHIKGQYLMRKENKKEAVVKLRKSLDLGKANVAFMERIRNNVKGLNGIKSYKSQHDFFMGSIGEHLARIK